jgi:hypothetical protein
MKESSSPISSKGVMVCGKMPRRNTAGYDLSPSAQKAVDKVCASRGMKKSTLVARVMEWFAAQPDFVQSVPLHIDGGMQLAYAAALEHLAKMVREGTYKPGGVIHDGGKNVREGPGPDDLK